MGSGRQISTITSDGNREQNRETVAIFSNREPESPEKSSWGILGEVSDTTGQIQSQPRHANGTEYL